MNNEEILLMCDSKLDAQFLIKGYNKLLRLDVSGKIRGLLDVTKSHLTARQSTKQNEKFQFIM